MDLNSELIILCENACRNHKVHCYPANGLLISILGLLTVSVICVLFRRSPSDIVRRSKRTTFIFFYLFFCLHWDKIVDFVFFSNKSFNRFWPFLCWNVEGWKSKSILCSFFFFLNIDYIKWLPNKLRNSFAMGKKWTISKSNRISCTKKMSKMWQIFRLIYEAASC